MLLNHGSPLRTNATDAAPPRPRPSRVVPPPQPTTQPQNTTPDNDDVQTMSYDHASQARDDAQSAATQYDRSLSCVVDTSINSGFDRSQEIPDNAPVAAYREAMAAVGSSNRSRRAQNRRGATSQLQTTPSQSDDESVQSQEEDDDGDMDSNDDETSHAYGNIKARRSRLCIIIVTTQ